MARGRPEGGARGGIKRLLGEARRVPGIGGQCILAIAEQEDDDETYKRRIVGGVLIAEGLHTLKQIQRLLTPKG